MYAVKHDIWTWKAHSPLSIFIQEETLKYLEFSYLKIQKANDLRSYMPWALDDILGEIEVVIQLMDILCWKEL